MFKEIEVNLMIYDTVGLFCSLYVYHNVSSLIASQYLIRLITVLLLYWIGKLICTKFKSVLLTLAMLLILLTKAILATDMVSIFILRI